MTPDAAQTRAEARARDWIDAWNRRDLEAVLDHYDDAVEVVSPLVVTRLGRADGTLHGKAALRSYFATGMAKPDLHFTLHDVRCGVDRVTILYGREDGRRVADTLHLGPDGRALRMSACYAGPAPVLDTRLTRAFGLTAPVVQAPMAGAAGGRLAAAVSTAGGLGLIGGGYGDADWIAREWAEAGQVPVGIGVIGWRLTDALLEDILARAPRAVFLSFCDPAAPARRLRDAGIPLLHQVQDTEGARAALDAGVTAVVAQGGEAGGHGATRGTMTLVPEIADLIAARAPDTLLLAAGGIADGRGLAAALMLGADGAVAGTRFWAATEALVPAGFHAAAHAASGDATLRTRAIDRARGYDWPAPWTCRVMRSAFTDRWHDADAPPDPDARAAFLSAQAAGDARHGAPIAGEAVGLIRDTRPAAALLSEMTADAARRLTRSCA